jgi:serine-type D-Ala-D-Ala carboxypeptidase (penicillin-binding protein 5/6)
MICNAFTRPACVVIVAGLISFWCGVANADGLSDPFPGFGASAYVLKVDGATLWQRNQDRRLPPASLTKIMTARIAIGRVRLDEVAVVSSAAARETGSRIGLRQGERIRAGFLIAATLLQSANDACHALADHVCGGEAAFVDLMNREARDLGMTETHFTNACGHDHRDHYSTARDLAKLAEASLGEPVFSEIVSAVSLDISTAGGRRVFHLENRNELLGRYPGTRGVKTGFTQGAGKCVIALVERGGTKVLFVVLNAPDRWWGSVEMLDAAFAHAAGRGGP